jgi:dUTP pyrophosphatase
MEVLFVKDNPQAVVPTKGTPYAVGYDLTAISVYKKLSEKTTLYDTGIKVQPPQGYYTEILPRSSMTKTGYCLSNSVGTIDSDYRGTLLIALTRIDESFPELTLPFTKCQLVLRRHEDYILREVNYLSDTARGDGGFGSTDKNILTSTIPKVTLQNSFC